MIQEKTRIEHEPPISSPGNVPLEKAIVEALDMEKWTSGPDLEGLYQRLEKETQEATRKEIEGWKILKREVIPAIEEKNKAAGIPCYALTQAEDTDLRRIHRGILFNGGVEAITGTLSVHQSLPLSVSQIGLCMVSYQGEMGTYSHRVFKKDLQAAGEKPKEAVFRALNQRMDNLGRENTEKQFSELAQRGLKAYSERAMLVEKSNANWLMGQGNPLPLEMLTDYWAKIPGLLNRSLEVLTRLVEHQRFIYVPRQPNLPAWLTLGHALEPLQFLVIGTLHSSLQSAIRKTEVSKFDRKRLEKFISDHGPKVVYGVFRTSFWAGPQMFYAHIDHIYTAVHIAMADSVLQEHRGYPMLLDIGRSICQATFNQKSFEALVQQAYAKSGNPFRFSH